MAHLALTPPNSPHLPRLLFLGACAAVPALYGLVATAWCYRVELVERVRCWPVRP